MNPKDVTFYSGGARGAEAAFGQAASDNGLIEVNFTFEGHHIDRDVNTRELTKEELLKSDMVMSEVSRRLKRDYSRSPWMRQILQSICHQVTNGFQVLVIGTIQVDKSVKGGTGWAVALAKLFNRPLHVFDQDKNFWYAWRNDQWQKEIPTICHNTVCGTGTRALNENGEKAIKELFDHSFPA